MSVFREKIEEPIEIPEEPQTPRTSPNLKPQEKIEQPVEAEETWDGEYGNKTGIEYFKAQDFIGDFKIKMDISKIDKFIKERIEEEGLQKSKANYHIYLLKIENEINVKEKDMFTRIKKLAEYTDLLKRIKELNAKKDGIFSKQD